jgi:hypothetical protein
MRRTSFITFISIAFAAVIGSAQADDLRASKHTARQHSKPESLRVFGCGVLAPVHFSACAADDRKCEVASKMRGCIVDDIPRRKREPPQF